VSTNQIVLLVSRAIAVIQCITALLEVSYLPERLMSLHHYRGPGEILASDYLARQYSTALAFLCFRIAVLLALAWAFWQCGPRLRRLLLPDGTNIGETREAPLAG
jgi:hypothetical protein